MSAVREMAIIRPWTECANVKWQLTELVLIKYKKKAMDMTMI